MILRVSPVTATARRPVRRAGMSLIEVIVAMAVFLICLTGIGRLVDSGTERAMEARYQTIGTRLAQSKMAEVEAGVIPVSSGGSGDFVEDGDDPWQWTVESTETDAANAYDVVVTVSRPFHGQTFSVKVAQIVFDPTAIGTATVAAPTPLVPPTTTTTGSGTTTTGTGQ
jgi:general secretion pathway protein I